MPPDGAPLTADPFALTDGCGAQVTLVEDPLAVPELAARAEHDGRPLWVFTVNDAARIRRLFEAPGITGVITDDPELACRVRADLVRSAR